MFRHLFAMTKDDVLELDVADYAAHLSYAARVLGAWGVNS